MDDHPDVMLKILRAAERYTAAEHLEVGLRGVKQKSGLKSESSAWKKPLSVNQNVTVVWYTSVCEGEFVYMY